MSALTDSPYFGRFVRDIAQAGSQRPEGQSEEFKKERQELRAGGNLKLRDKMAYVRPNAHSRINAFPDVLGLSGANVFAHDRFKLQ